MRILLDTNIVIHREASTVVNSSIGILFRWLDRLKYEKCIHPETLNEISRHQDDRVRRSFQAKLQSYSILKTLAIEQPSIAALRLRFDQTPNDSVDTALLNELVARRVDGIITEDQKLHQKAAELDYQIIKTIFPTPIHRGRLPEAFGLAEWVRRLRPCFASTGPGGLGSPPAPTTWGRPQGLDGTGRTGRKPRDRAGEESAVRVPEVRSEAQNRRDGALRGGRPCATGAAPQGIRLMVRASRRSIPSGLPPGAFRSLRRAGERRARRL
jgi:predicted nucleic acid-binding protein